MTEQQLDREGAVQPGSSTNNVATGITVGILGIMGVAIAIDASSVPSLALLAIVLIGSLIAGLVFWG